MLCRMSPDVYFYVALVFSTFFNSAAEFGAFFDRWNDDNSPRTDHEQTDVEVEIVIACDFLREVKKQPSLFEITFQNSCLSVHSYIM